MDCTRVKKTLTKYLRHSAEPSIAQDVEEHLTVCSSCRDHLERMLETEGRNALRKKLIPVAAVLIVLILIVAAFQLRSKASPLVNDAQLEGPSALESLKPNPSSSLQNALEKTFKGDWVAVFYDTFSGKSVSGEFAVKASFPQEEGEITLPDKTCRYLKVASVLSAADLEKTIDALRKKTGNTDQKLVLSSRLYQYLTTRPAATVTSIVYFYALFPKQ